MDFVNVMRGNDIYTRLKFGSISVNMLYNNILNLLVSRNSLILINVLCFNILML